VSGAAMRARDHFHLSDCRAVTLYGAETRSASRRPLVFVNEPTQPIALVHQDWWRISPTLDRWPTIGRRRTPSCDALDDCLMVDKHRQDSFRMPGGAYQQPVTTVGC